MNACMQTPTYHIHPCTPQMANESIPQAAQAIAPRTDATPPRPRKKPTGRRKSGANEVRHAILTLLTASLTPLATPSSMTHLECVLVRHGARWSSYQTSVPRLALKGKTRPPACMQTPTCRIRPCTPQHHTHTHSLRTISKDHWRLDWM